LAELFGNRHADALAAEAIEAADFVVCGPESTFGCAVCDDHQSGDARFISDILGFILADAADGDTVSAKDMSDVGEDAGSVGDGKAEVVSAGEFFAGLQRQWLAVAHSQQRLEGNGRAACGDINQIGHHGGRSR
jgi:hypothetical protein